MLQLISEGDISSSDEMRLDLGTLFPPDYRKALHALDCTRGGFSPKTKDVE